MNDSIAARTIATGLHQLVSCYTQGFRQTVSGQFDASEATFAAAADSGEQLVRDIAAAGPHLPADLREAPAGIVGAREAAATFTTSYDDGAADDAGMRLLRWASDADRAATDVLGRPSTT